MTGQNSQETPQYFSRDYIEMKRSDRANRRQIHLAAQVHALRSQTSDQSQVQLIDGAGI